MFQVEKKWMITTGWGGILLFFYFKMGKHWNVFIRLEEETFGKKEK